jgi:hypothetical protein
VAQSAVCTAWASIPTLKMKRSDKMAFISLSLLAYGFGYYNLDAEGEHAIFACSMMRAGILV